MSTSSQGLPMRPSATFKGRDTGTNAWVEIHFPFLLLDENNQEAVIGTEVTIDRDGRVQTVLVEGVACRFDPV